MSIPPDEDSDDPWTLPPGGRAAVQVEPEQPALRVATIVGVEPLDAQIGVFPKKNVPDALHDALFGQPDPTAAEIKAAGGNPAAVPPLQTYAILDATKVTNLPELLESSGLEHRCLFKGEAYDELKNVAPWIVRLEEGNAFTRNLFTCTTLLSENTSSIPEKHFSSGMYVRSRSPFDGAWRHFRRFTRVQNEHENWVYFRFWDSAIFPMYWRHFEKSHDRAALFFCSRDRRSTYEFYYLCKNVVTAIFPEVKKLNHARNIASPYKMDGEDHEFFQNFSDVRLKNKIKSRLLEKINNTPEEKKEMVPSIVDSAFDYVSSRSGKGEVYYNDCLSLSLLILLLGDASAPVLNGSFMNERLCSMSKRVALARETYFEAIDFVVHRST